MIVNPPPVFFLSALLLGRFFSEPMPVLTSFTPASTASCVAAAVCFFSVAYGSLPLPMRTNLTPALMIEGGTHRSAWICLCV